MVVCAASGTAGLVALTTGCVVPVPLELDQPDAAPNSPPIILSVKDISGNEYLSPGPITLKTNDETGRMFFTLSDNDAADTLEVDIYVDYNRQDSMGIPRPNNFFSTCIAPPGDTIRTTDCSLASICPALTGASNPHFFEAMVADRKVDIGGTPPFRAVPAPGLSSSRAWLMNCDSE